MFAWYISREQRLPELGDPYLGCGEQDLIPRTVTSVLVWCAGKELSQRRLACGVKEGGEAIWRHTWILRTIRTFRMANITVFGGFFYCGEEF